MSVKRSMPDISAVLTPQERTKLASPPAPSTALWHPTIQLQQANATPANLGRTIFQSWKSPEQLFYSNFANREAADQVYQTNLSKAPKVSSDQKCRVFPPLLLRYNDVKDRYIPVELLPYAELKVTQGTPDLVLNFHATTQSITFTVCDIKPEKMQDFQLFLNVVYSLMELDDVTVDVDLFTLTYDKARYATSRLPKHS